MHSLSTPAHALRCHHPAPSLGDAPGGTLPRPHPWAASHARTGSAIDVLVRFVALVLALGCALVPLHQAGAEESTTVPVSAEPPSTTAASQPDGRSPQPTHDQVSEDQLDLLANGPGADALAAAVDYDEVAAVRVLERKLLPTNDAAAHLALGHGVSAPDRLALGGAPPVRLLSGRREPTMGSAAHNPSLQVELDPRLQRALDQVELDLDAADANPSDGALALPFGLACADQPSVKQYLALLTASGSGTLKVWIRRSGKWKKAVEGVLKEEGVPTDLLYLAMIESGYRTRVKSPANAGGMWQFIPSTAADNGLRIDEWVDERFDPLKSTRAAARYLRKQKERFGTWPLAMAAYNGGAGTVSKAIDTFNSNDYFKLVGYGAMYEETRRYVPKILAAALLSKNAEAFGFDGIVLDEPWRYDEVEVPGDLRLALVADAAGTDLETLEELNPELLQAQTPPDTARYLLRLPGGTRERFIERFDELEKTYGSKHERVTLRFGETVEMVAARTGISTRVLRHINGLGQRQRAPYGVELIVPLKGRGQPQDGEQADDDEVVLVPEEEFAFDDRDRHFYRVNRGDELGEVAKHFGVRPGQLALWNDLDVEAHLRKGMTLQVWLAKDADTSSSMLLAEDDARVLRIGSPEYQKWREASHGPTSSTLAYKVKKGDSVSKIAKKHGVTTKDIIRWNNLDNNATIRPGMRLVLYPNGKAKARKGKK